MGKNKNTGKIIKFLELQEGDIFDAYGDILMKISPIENNRSSILNCIDLSNGMAYYIDELTDVIECKVKIDIIN